MQFKNESFLIYGLKDSGIMCANYLLNLGANVGLYDDDKTAYLSEAVNSLIEKGSKIADYMGDNEDNYDEHKNKMVDYNIVVVSPGVSIDNPNLVKLKRLNKRILGEIELAGLVSKSQIIAVTGTNGKTTVCTLIHKIFSEANESTYLLGNEGTPFISCADKLTNKDVTVLEVSSFQLETVHNFLPHIAVITNLTQDHLDRHYNMENYAYLKKRIFKNQRESEYLVLNYDDLLVRDFSKEARSKVVWFSVKERVDGGYLENGKLYYKGEEIIDADDLNIKGEHNIQNALCAICVSKIYGIESKNIHQSLFDFTGVKYRLERVFEYDGITYFNDSKSTNCDATIKAVRQMTKKTVLIIGGKDKNQDYTLLFDTVKNCTDKIKHIVFMGETKYDMLKCAVKCGFLDVSISADLNMAVKIAILNADRGENILFSPATSSFDMFKDYTKRGEAFNKIVRELNEEI